MDLYPLLRALLFRLDAEAAHNATFNLMRILQSAHCASLLPGIQWSHPVKAMGLTFENPLGLAAGLDKNGTCIDALGHMGFGCIEVGTVTPLPQPGNPKPRLFRIEEQTALLNRMGFNNNGVDRLVEQVRTRRYAGRIGINIGKNATTPLEHAAQDYRTCYRAAYPHADYIAINISSPNTQGLRELQADEALKRILDGLAHEEEDCTKLSNRKVPLAVKIAPDLDDISVEAFARNISDFPVAGVIATNTTIDRSSLAGTPWEMEAGGVSGAPLSRRSNEVIELLRAALPKHVSIIGVGGILSGEDAAAKLAAGADLIQLYTGFIYRGPALLKEIAGTLGR